MTDVFSEVRERVTARAAAERYGIEVKRDFARCPFHGEKTASLHFHDGGFYCFGCHEKGSSIDFTARLFGLDNLGAVRRLNEDFALGLTLDRPATPEDREAARRRREEQATRQRYEAWRQGLLNDLAACHRYAHRLDLAHPDRLTDRDVLAVRYKETVLYWADLLADNDMEKQMQVFRMKGEIELLICKILNRT